MSAPTTTTAPAAATQSMPAKVLPPLPVNPPADLPKTAPVMPAIKHPCRCSILGTMHTKDQLQEIVSKRADISDELKAVILAEIKSKTSNAAQVDLHVIDHDNGDSSICIHVKQVALG